MKCPNCKRTPPEGMMSPMFVNGGYTPAICAVCALEIGNRELGIERAGFGGETAQYFLEETKKHYEKTNQRT